MIVAQPSINTMDPTMGEFQWSLPQFNWYNIISFPVEYHQVLSPKKIKLTLSLNPMDDAKSSPKCERREV